MSFIVYWVVRPCAVVERGLPQQTTNCNSGVIIGFCLGARSAIAALGQTQKYAEQDKVKCEQAIYNFGEMQSERVDDPGAGAGLGKPCHDRVVSG